MTDSNGPVLPVLKSIPYFEGLPTDLLATVATTTELIELESGQIIIEEGGTSDELYVLVAGELLVTKQQESQAVELARIAPGEVVGEAALLEGIPRVATVAAARPSTVLKIPGDTFDRLLDDPKVARRMFRTVTSRLRDTEGTLRHGERMAALGRIAAQLMHELNNPAAAVGRTAQELGRIHEALQMELVHISGTTEDKIRAGDGPRSPLERARAEDDIASWLERQSIEGPWELAPPLVADGWTVPDLADFLETTSPELAPHLVRVVALRAASGQLIGELGIGAHRISELVRIVKEYSYLDQAPVQDVVVTAGIADTLVLLKHKLVGVTVVTDFPSDLAPISIPGRDLNQVWTNLIDNAGDAMEDGGTLTIRVVDEGDSVVVTVSDTGGGIPGEVLPRLFEPFFTTKEPGHGTGLGLHTVHTIVSRLDGTISVTSDDTGTTFKVTLPRS